MPALNRQILAPIPPHPTRSLKCPTKSLAKFYEPSSLSITQLTQHRLITFSMRLSLQRCKHFVALLTPHLATTHLAPWFSSAICFLTYPLLQISLPSLATAKPKLTPASSRLTPTGLSTTTQSYYRNFDRDKLDAVRFGPYQVLRVHTNNTVTLQRGSTHERVSIRHLTPFRPS